MDTSTSSVDERSPALSRVGLLLLPIGTLINALVLCRTPGRIVDGLPLNTWSAVAPFGHVEVAVVHLIFATAIGWLAARLLSHFLDRQTSALSVLCGGVIAVLTLYFADFSGLEIGLAATAGVRVWIRTLWATVLQLPWCIAAIGLGPGKMNPDHVDQKSSAPTLQQTAAISALCTILLPLAHIGHIARRDSRAIIEYASVKQYKKSWEHVVALESMAGIQKVGGEIPTGNVFAVRPTDGRFSSAIRSDLVQRLLVLIQESTQPLPPNAEATATIRRSSTLLSLDALEDAVDLLSTVSKGQPAALLLLATIHEERQEPQKAVKALEEAIANVGTAQGDLVEDIVRKLYQRLAQNLRRAQRYEDAEQRLLEALEKYNHSDGFFNFELGTHYLQGGRFQAAIRYFRACEQADSRYGPRVAYEIRRLQRNTPACFLTRPVPR